MSVADAVEKFTRFECVPGRSAEIVRELRGRNLACWCKVGEPCHADVLLEIANRAPAKVGGVTIGTTRSGASGALSS